LGGDKGYDTAEFVNDSVSLKKRKLVEQIFGWSKTIAGLRKARFVGLAKVKAQTTFTFAAGRNPPRV
jgi:hypothetical protein